MLVSFSFCEKLNFATFLQHEKIDNFNFTQRLQITKSLILNFYVLPQIQNLLAHSVFSFNQAART